MPQEIQPTTEPQGAVAGGPITEQVQQPELSLQIAAILEEQKKINRRLDTFESTINLIYKDREILEDIQGSIAHLKELTINARSHFDEAIKDVKVHIGTVGVLLEDAFKKSEQEIGTTVGAYKQTIEDHIKNLIENIKPKKVLLVNEHWFKKITHFFRK